MHELYICFPSTDIPMFFQFQPSSRFPDQLLHKILRQGYPVKTDYREVCCSFSAELKR